MKSFDQFINEGKDDAESRIAYLDFCRENEEQILKFEHEVTSKFENFCKKYSIKVYVNQPMNLLNIRCIEAEKIQFTYNSFLIIYPVHLSLSDASNFHKASEKIEFFSDLLKVVKDCGGEDVYDYINSSSSFYFFVDAQKMIGNIELSNSLKGMNKFKL